ncbi:MAG TPA: hypothetical protein VJS20_08305, partial [Gemmatimonadales bacterium]|nr:hypothetical protein [Gemmatimonadales bacterium]
IGFVLSLPESRQNRGLTLEAARLLLARGDLKAAEQTLRNLSGIEAGFFLGKLLAEQKRWSEATPFLLQSLGSSDRRPQALRLLAQGAVEIRDWVSATRYFGELVMADPQDSKALKALAACHQHSGDSLAALATAQRALTLAPGDPELIRLMSEVSEASASISPLTAKRNQDPQPRINRRRNR